MSQAKHIVRIINDDGSRTDKHLTKQEWDNFCLNKKKRIQEHKDALMLETFRDAIRRGDTKTCPDSVRDYLDMNLPGWRDI